MLDEALSADDLNSIRNYVNHHFSGWKLDKARRELLRRIEEERATYDAILRRLTLLYQKDRKSTRLNSSHGYISYAVFCLKKKKHNQRLEHVPHYSCVL